LNRAGVAVARVRARHPFSVAASLDANEGDKRVCGRNWDEHIDRDLV
jgi:hypothetical protein